jgi:hypothetical protein
MPAIGVMLLRLLFDVRSSLQIDWILGREQPARQCANNLQRQNWMLTHVHMFIGSLLQVVNWEDRYHPAALGPTR